MQGEEQTYSYKLCSQPKMFLSWPHIVSQLSQIDIFTRVYPKVFGMAVASAVRNPPARCDNLFQGQSKVST